MKFFWISLLALLRPIYFFYSFCCLFLPIFILYGAGSIFYPSYLPLPVSVIKLGIQVMLGGFVVVMLVIPILVQLRKSKDDSDPFQSAFMSWFATLRWYWNTTPGPMAKVGLPSGYLVENPMSYRLTAQDMREILSRIQPGDILLRAYDGYMDGDFIRLSSLCSKNGYHPGWFTHVAMYAGPLNENDRANVPAHFRNNKKYFQEGPQMIIHSMAMGVHTEDILTWFRCDYLVVLRLKPDLTMTHKVELPQPRHRKHSASELTSQKIKDELRKGAPINHDEVIQNAKLSALEKIGEPYDFECVETNKFDRFSCAELIYYCFRSAHDALGLFPQLHALYPLGKLNRHWSIMGRSTVTPDDFYGLAKAQHLDVIWIDEISKKNA
ncbi:hypothetical protein [Solimicrobium silvestre]|uniref:Permuted papain-like amidase enzyme, YaeF/YiiX, C92 family n=1 Tax=Solimicrobium silvestre TaxID=2099400 RepID=A0A2S9GWH0_9BURK|nr:hypothetical protein [Solimicrobium silvestre]PRC92064.1 hypothetical protein S2091_3199 [Solimicrobium silvestre]